MSGKGDKLIRKYIRKYTRENLKEWIGQLRFLERLELAFKIVIKKI